MSNEEFTDHQHLLLPVAQEIVAEGLRGNLPVPFADAYRDVVGILQPDEVEILEQFTLDYIEGKGDIKHG